MALARQNSTNSLELGNVGSDDYDDDEFENNSLLSHNSSRESWLKWASDAIRSNLIIPIQKLGSYAKQHPIIVILAITSALTTVVNSLLYAIQTKPEDLSEQAWNESSEQRKWLAGILMFCSFTVNVILGALFLPKAKSLFSKKTWTEHPIRSLTSLGLGSAAAFSLGVLTYETFGFSIPAALAMAGFSLPINFATRFASVELAEKRIYNKLINSDTKFQANYINQLTKINKKYVQHLNTLLSNASMEIDYDKNNPEKFYEALLLDLQKHANEMQKIHPDLFKNKLDCERVAAASAAFGGAMFDLTLATFIATCAYLIFTQKGYSGLDIADKWINGRNSTTFEGLDESWKIALGSPSGIASGFLYYLSAFDIRSVMASFAMQLMTNPKRIPFALILTAACVFSGSAMLNVAQGLANNTKGIFKNLIDHFPNSFVAGGATGGAVVNMKSAVLTAYPEELNPNHVTVKDLIKHFGNANDHPLTQETLKGLRNNSVFVLAQTAKPSKQPETNPAPTPVRPGSPV